MKIIINDQRQQDQKETTKEFNKFESVNLNVLQVYNEKEAKKAMLRHQRQQKAAKQNQPSSLTKKAMYDDSILVGDSRVASNIDETILEAEEEGDLTTKSIKEL